MGTLDGRVAVVLGGSSGFGEAIAERFVAEGARVVIAARGRERLEEVATRLGAVAFACDATHDAEIASLAERTHETLGGIDIAVNSAGFESHSPLAELTPDKVEPMVAVQFTGALYFLRHMANAMREGGSLITISSLTATLVAEGYAHYAGAKAGINHASRIAAAEYGPKGVRINVVSPSLIETPMTAPILNAPGVKSAFLEETPLGRIGTVAEVVDVVTWLSGDGARYVTGQNLHVDGGTSLRRLPIAEQFLRHAKKAMDDA